MPPQIPAGWFRPLALLLAGAWGSAWGVDYEVGPGKKLAALAEVPWEKLAPGDVVAIHWRAEPYREKFVLCARGTAERPIVVRGVAGPDGARPVIDSTKPISLWLVKEPDGAAVRLAAE